MSHRNLEPHSVPHSAGIVYLWTWTSKFPTWDQGSQAVTIGPIHKFVRSFETKHAGGMGPVPMDGWLNSDPFKKKESSNRTKIDRFGAFSVLTRFSGESRYTGRDHLTDRSQTCPRTPCLEPRIAWSRNLSFPLRERSERVGLSTCVKHGQVVQSTNCYIRGHFPKLWGLKMLWIGQFPTVLSFLFF